MWKERITEWSADAGFNPPATPDAIVDCERALGQTLPADLVSLLHESNGVEGEYGLGLIWPVERIKADNLMFRSDPDFASLYMPFEPLVFFAETHGGDQFAFVIRERPDDVFVWDHETDSRTMVTGSLAGYLERALDGSLEL